MSMHNGKRIDRTRMTRELVDAGNAYQAADNEQDKHKAAVTLLRLRLQFFTGYEEPIFSGDLDELCAKLTAAEVHTVLQLCWNGYQGGMEHMRETNS